VLSRCIKFFCKCCASASFKTADAVVSQAMASTEDKAYEIMRELDVDYVLVIFGGLTGYSSDGEPLFAEVPTYTFDRSSRGCSGFVQKRIIRFLVIAISSHLVCVLK